MDREEITVTVDPQLKASAEELFQDLGLDLSTAVTMFLKASIARQGLPFEVKRNTQNDELLARVAAYLDVGEFAERNVDHVLLWPHDGCCGCAVTVV